MAILFEFIALACSQPTKQERKAVFHWVSPICSFLFYKINGLYIHLVRVQICCWKAKHTTPVNSKLFIVVFHPTFIISKNVSKRLASKGTGFAMSRFEIIDKVIYYLSLIYIVGVTLDCYR